jgi:Gas vesicle synthesis protein GvpL/GvpF
MIYLYAICEGAAPLPGAEQRGLGRARVRAMAYQSLAAIFSRHRTLQPQPEPATLWAHEAVVHQLMSRGPVLPVRFGTMLDEETTLRRILADRLDELVDGLERVRGRVELSVRVLEAPGPKRPREQLTGHAYLMARRDAHQRASEAANEVHEPLAALAREARVRAPAPPPTIVAAAYLVDRPKVDAFIERVRALASARHDLSIVGTGPWPPYSFVPELRT